MEKFAADKGWTIDKYITDEGVSGGKDPDKRNLRPLLKLVHEGDVIICSEISRLGRDLYMVMDILHFCMERGCVIHTVKDRFTLGDDIQSKVLAFAFGLSAEIERQMIRQRTREGLRLRMKMGVILGRSPMTVLDEPIGDLSANKEKVIGAVQLGRTRKEACAKLRRGQKYHNSLVAQVGREEKQVHRKAGQRPASYILQGRRI